jgi:large subunit ribosomal protein L15
MQLHNIKRENPNKKARQVGRGGHRGKTSGRGGKGQTARAGNKPRPQMRDIIKKLPKLRGRGKNSQKPVSQPVQTVTLASVLKIDANTITREVLLKAGLIKRESGVLPQVKIVGNNPVSKKLVISKGIKTSAGARSIIEGAGGTIK